MATPATAVAPSLSYLPLGFHEVTCYVSATSTESLPPVTFSVAKAGFHWQEYFTADEADRLADALRAEAARARAVSA